MNVALVCDWFHPRVGGIELHLRDLALRLLEANHQVVVITPTPGDATVDGIRVVRIPGTRAPRFDFLVSTTGIRAIGDALRREHADVAHCHVSIVSPAALGGANEAQRTGVPTVLTFHSVVPQTRLLAKTMRTLLGTDRWAAEFSAVSRRVAGEVTSIAPKRSMSILSNGIDSGFWRACSPHTSSECIELISVMRLNPKKRPLALVHMLCDVLASAPDRRVRLTVVGDGPERARLEREIHRRGVVDHVRLLGRRSREDIRELLHRSDAFVLPTIRESFGLAALEARCAGVPVVAMRASGVSEIIADGREGLLADSDADLTQRTLRLVRDAALRQQIAEHNRTTTPDFDWPRVVEAHLAIYRDAIALRDSVRRDSRT